MRLDSRRIDSLKKSRSWLWEGGSRGISSGRNEKKGNSSLESLEFPKKHTVLAVQTELIYKQAWRRRRLL